MAADNELLHLVDKYPKDAKIIVLDSDGVVTNFVSTYCEYVRAQGHDHVDESQIKSYMFLGDDFFIEPDRSNHLFKSFTDSGGFRDMKLNPGARELFDYLKDNGWTIVIATDVPTRAELHRMVCYEKAMLRFDEMVFTVAKARCARHLKARIIVDDKPSNLYELLHDCDAIVAKVSYPFNADIPMPETRVTHLHNTRECWDLGGPEFALFELLQRVQAYDRENATQHG